MKLDANFLFLERMLPMSKLTLLCETSFLNSAMLMLFLSFHGLSEFLDTR